MISEEHMIAAHLSGTTVILALLLLVGAAPAALAAPVPMDTPAYRLDSVRVEVTRLRAGGVPLSRLPYGAEVLPVGAGAAGDLTPW